MIAKTVFVPAGGPSICNRFSIGDRLDKSVEHMIKQADPQQAFVVTKAGGGWLVMPVNEVKQEKKTDDAPKPKPEPVKRSFGKVRHAGGNNHK
jgi:hypothetical protein